MEVDVNMEGKFRSDEDMETKSEEIAWQVYAQIRDMQ